jgi:hypothetical protein
MLNRDIFNLIFKENAEFESPIYQSKLLFINKEIHNYYLNYLETIKEINIGRDESLDGIKYVKNLNTLIMEEATCSNYDIDSLKNLHTLAFDSLQLIDNEIEFMDELELEYLDINNCSGYTEMLFYHICQKFKKLTTLQINDINLSNRIFKNIKFLKNLEQLSLPSTNIFMNGIKYLSKLKNLKILDVGNIKLYDDIDEYYLKYFGKFKSLEKLILFCDNLHLITKYIKNIGTLKYLKLSGCHIDIQSINDLVGNIKDIEFYYCEIDTDVLQYISENIDKINYLEIRGEIDKYTDIELDIIDNIIENKVCCSIDIC